MDSSQPRFACTLAIPYWIAKHNGVAIGHKVYCFVLSSVAPRLHILASGLSSMVCFGAENGKTAYLIGEKKSGKN